MNLLGNSSGEINSRKKNPFSISSIKNYIIFAVLGALLSQDVNANTDNTNLNDYNIEDRYSEEKANNDFSGKLKVINIISGRIRAKNCSFGVIVDTVKKELSVILAKHCTDWTFIDGKFENVMEDIIINPNLAKTVLPYSVISKMPAKNFKSKSEFNSKSIKRRNLSINIGGVKITSPVIMHEGIVTIYIKEKYAGTLDGLSGTPVEDENGDFFGVLSSSGQLEEDIKLDQEWYEWYKRETEGFFPILIAPINIAPINN